MKQPLHLLCDCGADCITVDFSFGPDEDGYIVFSSFWYQGRRWRDRLRGAWEILRGKEHYFSEIILRPDQVEEMKEYIGELAH